MDETTREVLRLAAGAFYRALHAQERIRLVGAAEQLAASVHAAADRRFKSGDIAVLDVNIARVSLAVLGVCAGLMLLLGWRTDINVFSLNAFYRNRLVRAYLGATRLENGHSPKPGPAADRRTPQNFTGFDEKDDLPLAHLIGRKGLAGPLHIVNCALNLGGSSDLSLHTRHSASFRACSSSASTSSSGSLASRLISFRPSISERSVSLSMASG